MKTESASSAQARTPNEPTQRILVWDAPLRTFHWLMVLSFAGAYVTGESERWRLEHVTLGYTMLGLVVFRIVWGLIGTRHARFSQFVRGPGAVARYFSSLLRGRPEHHAGHNPAGALSIVALLLLAVGVIASGWALDAGAAGKWLEEVHEAAANLMLALVGVHIAAVVLSSWLHRENLVRAMIGGRKQGAPREAIRSAWRSLAAIMLAAVLGFWWFQLQYGAGAVAAGSPPGASAKPSGHGEDDDD